MNPLMYTEVYGVLQWSPVVVLSCRVLFLLFLEIIFIIVDVEFGCPGFGLFFFFFLFMFCFVTKSSQPLSIPSFGFTSFWTNAGQTLSGGSDPVGPQKIMSCG